MIAGIARNDINRNVELEYGVFQQSRRQYLTIAFFKWLYYLLSIYCRSNFCFPSEIYTTTPVRVHFVWVFDSKALTCVCSVSQFFMNRYGLNYLSYGCGGIIRCSLWMFVVMFFVVNASLMRLLTLNYNVAQQFYGDASIDGRY